MRKLLASGLRLYFLCSEVYLYLCRITKKKKVAKAFNGSVGLVASYTEGSARAMARACHTH